MPTEFCLHIGVHTIVPVLFVFCLILNVIVIPSCALVGVPNVLFPAVVPSTRWKMFPDGALGVNVPLATSVIVMTVGARLAPTLSGAVVPLTTIVPPSMVGVPILELFRFEALTVPPTTLDVPSMKLLAVPPVILGVPRVELLIVPDSACWSTFDVLIRAGKLPAEKSLSTLVPAVVPTVVSIATSSVSTLLCLAEWSGEVSKEVPALAVPE